MNETFAIQGFSSQNGLWCVLEDSDIIQTDYMGNRKKIGKTLRAYQDLEDTCTEYYDKLVELGVIIPQKSQEEMLADLQKTVAALTNEIKELRNNEPDRDNQRSGEDVPAD